GNSFQVATLGMKVRDHRNGHASSEPEFPPQSRLSRAQGSIPEFPRGENLPRTAIRSGSLRQDESYAWKSGDDRGHRDGHGEASPEEKQQARGKQQRPVSLPVR